VLAGDLWLIDVNSAEVRRANTHSVDVSYAEWRSDRKALIAGHRDFDTVVGLYDRESDSFTEVWSSRELTTGGFYASAAGFQDPGDFVLVSESFTRAPEIARVQGGQYTPVRSLDLGYLEHARFIRSAEPINWRAPDGLQMQGWLLQPYSAGPHALVMRIHGGPVWHTRPRWLPRSDLHVLLLLKRGYAVFFPNPRGSAGRGQDFVRHVVGDMGGADAHDCLSGLDYLVMQGIADPKRLGVMGVSYGGFLSAWLITQDVRFAAAVSIAPATNQVTSQLLSNIPDFVRLFLDDHYRNAGGKYYQRSPIMYAHQVRTPTLNICGARDRCTPPTEASQFHNALLENGVRSVLITYPEEGHGINNYPAVIDYTARILEWFEQYMGGRQGR